MNQIEDIAVQHQICKATYSLCRVVGYKYVLKHFPHEVNHLEECLFLLKKQVSAILCKCIILTNVVHNQNGCRSPDSRVGQRRSRELGDNVRFASLAGSSVPHPI